MGWLIVLGIIVGIGIFVWLINMIKKARKYDSLWPVHNKLEVYSEELKKELHGKSAELESYRKAVETMIKEKSEGFPWLAGAYADYFYLRDIEKADYLSRKRRPATKAAEELRQIARERRSSEKAARVSAYLIDYCRYLAPWLDEYIGLDSQELDAIIKNIHGSWEKQEEEIDDEVKRNLGPEKYKHLTPTERLQKKLDWYWQKPQKLNWQIGRDYERYIGYLYETKGWQVDYHGKKGFEDLGRDLICKKGEQIEIVQCKRWAKDKLIHEKHIYYLFGTTVEYFLENFDIKSQKIQLSMFPNLIQEGNVIPKIVTTIEVSPKAEQVSNILGVVVEKVQFDPNYPSVKCNVALKNGEKIFHLPFDQQYDNVLIKDELLECYVKTIAEAEALGFRHAYRWTGNKI